MKARCSECGYIRALRSNGTVVWHSLWSGNQRFECKGSEKPPKVDAVDPHAADPGTPTPRDLNSSNCLNCLALTARAEAAEARGLTALQAISDLHDQLQAVQATLGDAPKCPIGNWTQADADRWFAAYATWRGRAHIVVSTAEAG